MVLIDTSKPVLAQSFLFLSFLCAFVAIVNLNLLFLGMC